ncbi:Uncharacterized protein conserved in bacteria [Actinomyces bovis]|uniref:Uncharacterized protein conserved in bacteria n=1 Tax=Actinomyces bovis TaxID=1658 RepID=A0ABY1VM07_9ACTO|nr:resuscitation-promoting factor [Actinomyces bovis]SPT53110.1 Uncharacterized protein conserved in bacteria [Actinomyces bovis]VEG56612.1 Uncharacterized protein conserved in bacteria [Actinomyces israelii]
MTDSRQHNQSAAEARHASNGLLRGSMLRAGAVAVAVAMAVSGAAYAATLQAQSPAPAEGTAVAERAALLGIGESPAGANAVEYTLVVDGQIRSESTTATTWGAALLAAGVGVSTADGDTVSEPLDAAPAAGQTITVNHVTVSTEAKEEKDPHGTVEQESNQLDKGEKKVKTEGKDGLVRTTYTVRTVGGQELGREIASQVVASAKVDEVVLVGTREKKAGSTSSSGASAAAAQAPANDDGSLDDDFARLAQCESGGNPRAVNPAGYYGLYQFSLATWASVGGTGNPIDASPEEQLKRAKILQARSGWGQWGCSH